jgi:hypothetical protein
MGFGTWPAKPTSRDELDEFDDRQSMTRACRSTSSEREQTTLCYPWPDSFRRSQVAAGDHCRASSATRLRGASLRVFRRLHRGTRLAASATTLQRTSSIPPI